MAQLFGIQKVDAGYTTRKLGIGRVIKGEKLVEVVGHQGSNLEQGDRLFPEFIEVVVPDDEIELYQKTIPNPLIAIPKELKGLGPVRNWCINNFKEETVIMIDDDINLIYNIDKEEALEVLINTAIMAKDAGVGCFEYTQTDIRKYNGTALGLVVL